MHDFNDLMNDLLIDQNKMLEGDLENATEDGYHG